MPSWKSYVIGGIAIGGAAVAAYATYRWYKSKKRTEKNPTTATCSKQQKDSSSSQVPLNMEDQRSHSIPEPCSAEIKQWLAQFDPHAPRRSYVPKVLRGLKSMREFENTLEALAAYLLGQPRSEEELLEAQQELGWWWNLVVAFHDRVPKELPNFEDMLSKVDVEDDGVLPLTDENGMQSVD